MSWWQRLWNRRALEEQLEKELLFHLDQHTADLIARGHTPEEARRQARQDLGGPEQVKEACRDARGTRWLEDVAQDTRYALRTMWRMPGFTAVALLTLALGTGATTVMFTVVNGVLLRPLPYPEPDRLVALQERTERATRLGNLWAFSYPNFLDCRRESRTLVMAAFRYSGGTVTVSGQSEYVDGLQISSELFSVLDVPLEQGRAFLPEEDKPGAAPVVIVSHGLWQRLYGGRPAAIGRSLAFEGKAYTVVGVAAAGFLRPLSLDEADVFTPLGQQTQRFMQDRDVHPGIQVWARLLPGVSLTQAQAELAVTGRHLAVQYPKSNEGRTFIADTLRPDVEDVRSTLWLLLGAVTLVLLMACVNVASLLLARAVSRQRELAVRVALGAGRSRVTRQCLTESAVLAVSGGFLGVVLAALGVGPFVVFWPGSLPRAEEVHVDWHVLLFALGISLVSGLLFGLMPVLRVPARNLEQAFRAGARTVAGSSRRLHGGFVVAEIALAVVLLASAGILGRTLLRLSSVDPGVNVHNVLVTRMALSAPILANPSGTRAAWQDVLDRARRVPGVEAIALVDTVPMRQGYNELGYWITPAAPPGDEQPVALATSVTPDYLKVMGIRLRQGRFFNDEDRAGSEPVIVIDEVLAHRAFGRAEATGKRLWIPDMTPGPFLVVGVVGHVRHWGPASDDQARVRAQLYYPFAQVPDPLVRRWSELMSIAVRTSIDPLSAVESLRRELRGAAGDQVLYEIRTMEQLARATLDRQRFLLLLFGMFAGLALLLAGVGVYGVLAYLTNQRVPEIAVRMALGASAHGVVRLVLGQSLEMTFVGSAAGIAAALAAARLLERLVPGVQSAEPATLALMVSVLVVAALVASIVPARRASRVDPMTALRQE